jgi:hypothetical protein
VLRFLSWDLSRKKIHPRYNKPRRYGCKTLRAIYEKLDKYEVVEAEEPVVRRKQEKIIEPE